MKHLEVLGVDLDDGKQFLYHYLRNPDQYFLLVKNHQLLIEVPAFLENYGNRRVENMFSVNCIIKLYHKKLNILYMFDLLIAFGNSILIN